MKLLLTSSPPMLKRKTTRRRLYPKQIWYLKAKSMYKTGQQKSNETFAALSARRLRWMMRAHSLNALYGSLVTLDLFMNNKTSFDPSPLPPPPTLQGWQLRGSERNFLPPITVVLLESKPLPLSVCLSVCECLGY